MTHPSAPAGPQNPWARPDSAPTTPANKTYVAFGQGAVDDALKSRLSGVVIKGGLLSILTLTVYRFWMKTNYRRLVWSETRVGGEAFEYTGKPMELFIGSMIAIAFLAVWLGAANLALAYYSLAFWQSIESAFVLAWLITLPLIAFATYRARRYRLLRTKWRGIRCGMTGSALSYTALWAVWSVIELATLYLLRPVKKIALERRMSNHMLYGDAPVSFHGTGWALMGRWLLVWIPFVAPVGLIGTAVTIGLLRQMDPEAFQQLAQIVGRDTLNTIQFWPAINPGIMLTPLIAFFTYGAYAAAEMAYVIRARRVGGVTFSCKLRMWDWLGPQLAGMVRWFFPGALAMALAYAILVGAIWSALAIEGRGFGEAGGMLLSGQQGDMFVLISLVETLPAKIVMGAGLWSFNGVIIVLALWVSSVVIFYRLHRNICAGITVHDLASLDSVRQRTRDDQIESEGFADALDVGGL